MPPAARTNDPTGHGNPLNPGPGSNDVLIGYMPAWRALPSSVASALDAISNTMKSFLAKPVMTPADAAADIAEICQNLTEGGAKAAAAGAPAAASAAGTQLATLNSTNAALTTTWTSASAAPGGQPAANTAYTEGIKAAAGAAASAVVSAMSSLADMHICPIPAGTVPHGPGFVTRGSGTVLINNLPACRQSDKVMEACGGADPISIGDQTVLIGDQGGGGGGGGGGAGGGGGSSGGGDGGAGGDEEASAESTTTETETEPQERVPGPSSEKVDTGTHWVSIELVDEANQPVVGEPFIVRLPQGERTQEVRSCLDARGTFRVEGLKRAGACTIRFPNLDMAAWQRWTGKAPPPAAGATAPPAPGVVGPVPAGWTTARGQWRTVRQGECLSSIAADTGQFWDTLWNHPANAELKRRRGDPNILLPGDAVFVPEKRPKEESANTNQHHKFMRRGEPHWLDVKLLRNGEPRANEPYTLEAGGEQRTGTTDAQGRIHEPLRGNARRATLTVGSDVYRFVLGGVDPLSEVSGVQQRLNNLGFACGPVDGRLGPRTIAALNLFRQRVGLSPSQKLDQATLAKLNDVHDRMTEPMGSADAVDEATFENYGLQAKDLDTTEAPDPSGPVG